MEAFKSVTPDPPPKAPPSARHEDASVVGAAAGRALAILVRRLPTFLVIALVTYAPLFVYAVTWDGGELDRMLLVLEGGALLLQAILTAALTSGVVEELAGRRLGVARGIAMGLTRVLPTLGLVLVMAAMYAAVIAAVAVPLAMVAPRLATLVGAVATAALSCVLFVAVPALVVEKHGVGGAIARSAQLTRGSRLSIVGVLFLIGVVVRFASFVTTIVLLPPPGTGLTVDGVRLLAFATIAILMVASLVVATISIVTYALLRDEQDGVGAGELAEVFD